MKYLILLCCLLAGCESTRDFAKRHPVASGSEPAAALDAPAAKMPCYPQPNGSCR